MREHHINKVRTRFIHELHIQANTVLCVIINLLYLNFPDNQLLCVYMITQYQTHIASLLIYNKC